MIIYVRAKLLCFQGFIPKGLFNPGIQHFGVSEKDAIQALNVVWVQASTPKMGMTFLKLYKVTKNERYLGNARDAALAIVKGQLGTRWLGLSDRI